MIKKTLHIAMLTFFTLTCAYVASARSEEHIPEIGRLTSRVAQEAGRSVVSISTEVTQRVGIRGRGSRPGDEFMRRFFEEFFDAIPEREFRRQGLGSGVIIDEAGYILTNNHVVGEADKIMVRLSDGREFEAEIKGADPRSDLAVIKIPAEDLPVATLGDSNELELGEWVMAIGNPFGFAIGGAQPTVTVGVVSALDRTLPFSQRTGRRLVGLIQTDAAINPGNSGGPLVNLKGEVIGINTAIITTTGGYQGLGFAIEVNRAKRVLDRLKRGEEVLYGWLGVSVQAVTTPLKEYFELDRETGILVINVIPDSPADKAGLREKDIIMALEGKEVSDIQQFVDAVSGRDPGSEVSLDVIRDGRKRQLDVRLGVHPGTATEVAEEMPDADIRGLTVETITPEVVRRFDLPVESGVVVTDIEPGSAADRAGIRKGDVITHIEGERVRDKNEFGQILRATSGNVLLRTLRGFVVLGR